MKRIILLATFISAAIAFGQKGSWYLGGSTGISSILKQPRSIISKSASWSFSPEVGTFVSDQIQIGLGLTVSGYRNSFIPANILDNMQFGGRIYGRYVFGKASFKPFVGISTNYLGRASNLSSGFGSTGKLNIFNVSLNAGFAYSVSPRFSIFGSVGVFGFTHSRTGFIKTPDQTSNNFSFNSGAPGGRLTVGIYYTFCKGKSGE
ncbi:MAG: hypothetical protein K0S23_2953 [Fluviicola sp.]|jgi:outer membrane protein|uniref:hypothetical protein n=1 Tax=Fluviicola sp. TaxID=1917219 RepID=UPI0026169862|nr:hypothetical protein [Fluviicola sp.]MDF3028646.1 hypothetical protein [Fluviicola sp.]